MSGEDEKKRKKKKVYGNREEKDDIGVGWLGGKTFPRSYMPKEYLEKFMNPYLERGFRPVPNRLGSILLSVFEIHNQTINIWSHLIALVVYMYFFYETFWVDEFFTQRATTEHRWVHGFFLLSLMYTFVVSVVFHTCSCHSLHTYDVVAHLDFSGVFAIIGGSTLTCVYYGYACQPNAQAAYLIGVLLLYVSLSVFAVATRNHVLRVTIAAILTSVVPISLMGLWTLHRGAVTPEVWVVGWKFLLGFVLYAVAFLFYVSKIPERFKSRTFDLVGASHQLWHLFGILAALWQYHCLHYFYNYYFADHEVRCAEIEAAALHGRYSPFHYAATWFMRLYEHFGWPFEDSVPSYLFL